MPHARPADPTIAGRLIAAARTLSAACDAMRFAPPVTHVYNPLDYAWAPYQAYVRRYAAAPKRAVFVGMNPGPFGMMQCGVPFGEIAAVRGWMGIDEPVAPPAQQHPKRPIQGFDCPRSEVSGRRLWAWAAARFGSAERFFEHSFVLNYCPLVFLEASGRNRTPEQLPAAETGPLYAACDAHLRAAIAALDPDWVIGIGGFAARRVARLLGEVPRPRVAQVLHPSPASPAANRGWSDAVDATLAGLGVYSAADA